MTIQKATPTEQVGATGKATADDTTIIPATPLNLQYSTFLSKTYPGITRQSRTWSYLVKSLEQPDEYASKEKCPLVKLATYGDTPSVKGMLRHGPNMLKVCGIEADYDGEQVSVEKAAAMLEFYGIEAAIYTSPSHTEERPRWRVLAPLSQAYPVADRRRFIAMLNSALGGILAGESFTPAQCFFFGKVRGAVYRTRHVRGTPVDLNLVLSEQYPADKVAPTESKVAPAPRADLDELRERMHALPVATLTDYHTWLNVGMAAHHEAHGSDEGLDLWDEVSSKAPNYAGRDDLARRWDGFGQRTEGPLCTANTLERLSGGVALSSDFDDVSPTDQERDERADQARAALDAKRREHQKRENGRIGEGAYRIPIAEKITLESALERFVFLSEGSQVTDVFNPHYVLKLPDWKNTYAASTKELPGQPGKPPRAAPVTQLWHTSEQRKTATTRTFKAGGGLLLADPDGKLAVNSWRPFDRSLQVADPQAAGVGLFVDHVGFLFGDDAPRFLHWLAHIEQRPGVLPHTSWLHIARHFGMGRNWLASVLARVWAGSVAANLDLVHMFKSSFNDQLSRKVLAVVDEIREGGRDSQWEHSEKLKSTITEEVRRINPKYGHTSMEFNACRWLLFSNHLSAIPLENGDRRIEVVSTDAQPQDPAYYTRLYRALESREFIAAVATVLHERDITGFNPGAHARNTEAKRTATKASQTPMAEACQLLVHHWPADFITSADLFDVLSNGQGGAGTLSAAHRRTLEQAGIQPFGRAVKIDGKVTRVSVVRNTTHWLQHGTADDVRKGLECVEIDAFEETAYEYLLGLEADA